MGLFVTLSINDTQYAQRYAVCRYAVCRYAVCHYAVCRYAVCRYTECRGAVQTVCPSLIFVRNAKSYTSDTPP
jgi:hypothetical protein